MAAIRTSLPPAIMQIIRDRAQAYGLDPDELARRVQIESSGNPRASTGSYHGLLQLSQGEFARHGGTGNIFDPRANLDAGARKMAEDNAAFAQKYGRAPTPTDSYLIHQQGEGGYAMHMANPDRPAWQNMYMTGEGQQKGPDWARRAVWGNVPSDVRSQYPGGVETLTSRQFADIWRKKVEGSDSAEWSPATATGSTTTPAASLVDRLKSAVTPTSGLLASAATPSVAAADATGAADATTPASTPADTLATFGQTMRALASQNQPQLPAPQPIQFNYAPPYALRMAQIAALRGTS